jgi:hypothetical protein
MIARALHRFLDAPEPIWRIELIRALSPIAILCFLSSRLAHPNEWLGVGGFRVPDLGGDQHQAMYLPALPEPLALLLSATLIVSGVLVALGVRVRISAIVFAAALAWVGLADRLSAFTVTKLAPVIAIGLAASAAGTALTIRKDRVPWTELRPAGALRFFQALIVVFYSASGFCKARGDWLKVPDVLFTHLHDSYQTTVSLALASSLPRAAWTIVQGFVLLLELLAPIWFGWKTTRPFALLAAVLMHALIGLMFWPVRWFALLMIVLLVGCFVPESLVDQAFSRGKRE